MPQPNEAFVLTPQTAAPLSAWLTAGGDERIVLDPATGLNRYGCAARPDAGLAAFGSSTISVVSPAAFAAAERALGRLAGAPSPCAAYAAETEAIRRELAGLCGLAPGMADNLVLAASGTDLHLIAADLARDATLPLVTVMPDPAESGRGVARAVRGLRYGRLSPHGQPAAEGAPLCDDGAGDLVPVAIREPDGAPRPAEAVDADFERAVLAAARSGRPVLAVLLDVSKTGIVAPTPACAARLKRRLGERLSVLVDGCQFRFAPGTLARYLDHGFLVAVTGSKFLGGPAFSGALFVPPAAAERLRSAPLAPALGDYSARADWPAAFAGRAVLPDLANLGLALRWRAALHELSAFRRLPPEAVAATLQTLAAVVRDRLERDPALEPLPTPPPRRFDDEGWDATPSIFPFLVLRDGRPLPAAETQGLYEALLAEGVRLGQPVQVGTRDGEPVSALRLAIGARQLVAALEEPDGRRALAARALAALGRIAQAAGATTRR